MPAQQKGGGWRGLEGAGEERTALSPLRAPGHILAER